eukprot:gene28416-24868_t
MMLCNMLILQSVVSALTLTPSPSAAATPLLPSLSIDPGSISISGLSSGADFVVQLQVAHSALIKGVGVFAGQPYHCAVHHFGGPQDPLVSQCRGTRDD